MLLECSAHPAYSTSLHKHPEFLKTLLHFMICVPSCSTKWRSIHASFSKERKGTPKILITYDKPIIDGPITPTCILKVKKNP